MFLTSVSVCLCMCECMDVYVCVCRNKHVKVRGQLRMSAFAFHLEGKLQGILWSLLLSTSP